MKLNKTLLKQFITLLLAAANTDQQLALLDFFLTGEEKINLSSRLSIIKELLRGEKSQREIAKNLQVSIAKITRGSNELKRLDNKNLDFLKKFLVT